LAAQAAEFSEQSERDRRLAPQLVSELAQAGLFRLCVPVAVGGLEAHPAVLIESVEALAKGDGSAGWCVAIGATSGLLAGYLPEAAARAIYAEPDTILGGAFAPMGRAAPADGGFRVRGRWPFASGCEYCDWLMGGSVVEEQGQVQMLPGGMPDVRLMLAPAAAVRIHDTWHVTGLRGTGSHDIEFSDLLIPREHSASVFSDRPAQNGPLYAFPLFGLLALSIAGVSLGIARGAIEDFVGLAQQKTPIGSRRRLAHRSVAQSEIAKAEAGLRAARTLLLDTVERAWEVALDSGEVPVPERASLRLAATHATTTAADVVQSAYRLAGASAIYETNPLQRRLRDANVATQHVLVAPATWEFTGRLLLGVETDTTQL
jgi:alkylation response protein AidB-like acyl-CoA dehydrogenase